MKGIYLWEWLLTKQNLSVCSGSTTTKILLAVTFWQFLHLDRRWTKLNFSSAPSLPAGIEFGSKIEVALTSAEQKFADFNNSFSTAATAVITLVK